MSECKIPSLNQSLKFAGKSKKFHLKKSHRFVLFTRGTRSADELFTSSADRIVMSFRVTFSTRPSQQGSEWNAKYLNKCTCVLWAVHTFIDLTWLTNSIECHPFFSLILIRLEQVQSTKVFRLFSYGDWMGDYWERVFAVELVWWQCEWNTKQIKLARKLTGRLCFMLTLHLSDNNIRSVGALDSTDLIE